MNKGKPENSNDIHSVLNYNGYKTEVDELLNTGPNNAKVKIIRYNLRGVFKFCA